MRQMKGEIWKNNNPNNIGQKCDGLDYILKSSFLG